MSKKQRDAEAAYWSADEVARTAHMDLAHTTDPHRRAKLLRTLAELEIEMARQHRTAFGNDWLDDDRIDMSASLAHSSHIYGLLRHVEYAVSVNRPRFRVSSGLDQAAVDVLDEMAATSDLTARMRLLKGFYDIALPFVRAQAGETIACLPSPGMIGWLTLDEHPEGAGIALARGTR